MKKLFLSLITCVLLSAAMAQQGNLRVIIIRHGEKPLKGDNLDCQGLNRALLLPAMLVSKFGVPDYTYVPSMAQDISTRHSRMFQTIMPLAAKYNLTINSKYSEKDSAGIAYDIKQKTGTVLVVWEHKAVAPIVKALGVPGFAGKWDDNDYESIWIISFVNGVASVSYDKEGLLPKADCP